MKCTAPLYLYKRDPAKCGGVAGLTADARKALVGGHSMVLPCGHCMACKLARAQEWSLRCMHEAKMYDSNVFVTLTYDDAHLPADYSLHYEHFQLFMHRLRKSAPGRGRFVMCGEYGDDNGRPHYHAILFNCAFLDKKFWKKVGGVNYYLSEELSKLWGYGFVSVGDVTLASAGYVARYTTKKISGPSAGSVYQWLSVDGEVFDREPPFLQASLKPGIGFAWFEKYWKDCFPSDYLIYRGKRFPVPRYYMTLYERMNLSAAEQVKVLRKRQSLAHRGDEDNSMRRQIVRNEFDRLTSQQKREMK